MEVIATMAMSVNAKTRLFNLLRRPFCNSHLERDLLKVTMGKDPKDLLSRLAPNHYQYPPGSLRDVTRYGFSLKLDLSDMVQWYVYWGLRDPSHEALISICRPGDIVLDVGANIGLTALRMSAAVGYGRVYAFEPDPENYSELLSHVHTNHVRNITALQYALGTGEGTGSLRRPAPGNRGCNWVDTVEVEGPNEVRIATVDDFCEGEGLSRIDLIKIDTEGAELAVLRGARMAIDRWKPRLFLEVDSHNIQRTGDTPADLWDFLAGAGYIVRHADSGQILRSSSDLADGHFDIICEAHGQRSK